MNFLLAVVLALSIDTDGMIKINGQRTFMLGLYDFAKTSDPKTSDQWKDARDAGFNLVHTNATATDLQKAAQHGLYAWTGVGALNGTNEAAIRKTVETLRNEQALILWETEDEPTFVWKKPLEIRTPAERIIATRKLVQSLDPKRLFYLNQSPTNLVSTLRKYNEGTDVVATDVYPVIPRGLRNQYALWPDGQQGDFLNESISQVGQYMDKMRQVSGPSKPVFMVLQGFAWESIQKEPDPKMMLYPTKEQGRFMAYQSIVHGANGILYWGLHLGPANNPAWQTARAVASELKQIPGEIAARPLPAKLALEYFDTGHSLDRGIAYTVRPSKDSVLVIAVNEDKNPVDVAISGLSEYKSCQVEFGTQTATLRNGVLRHLFEPFGARVFRCRR
ncbi:MAG TPA: hypothetical protein VFQ91_22360 [Bryobacteraceae bacterium]|nr:hypothetical protein [Bryobacteraceae bacterium]